jgi:hypothetical protein
MSTQTRKGRESHQALDRLLRERGIDPDTV